MIFTVLRTAVLVLIGLLGVSQSWAADPSTWNGSLQDAAGRPLAGAHIELRGAGHTFTAVSSEAGAFSLTNLPAGKFSLSVTWSSGKAALSGEVEIAEGSHRRDNLRLTMEGAVALQTAIATESTGGEQLSSRQVSGLPLNKRDFSQLLLLASGTQTDTNGAANFTQQFTVNGQRGTATVFAMDGVDTTDPEMGGATFSNFNVDAIQEINSLSGVFAAEFGHGASGFTNIGTKSGTNELHGSVFEFVRNAVFDARNFFDRQSLAQPGRLPPFNRNEFGFTNGGPVVIPRLYDGRNRTYYYGQYQGFRQVLGTTQVLPVPTEQERLGYDTTAFPGDTLIVPVDPQIAPVLAAYPLPNDPQGPYGARTYATSSKVHTVSNQFSARLDHRISPTSQLLARFNYNNVNGPITNPSQTAIDPSFAVQFFDHQRNAALTYTLTPTPNLVLESSLGFIRSTPNFPASNHTQPGLSFGDGLYEAFNSPGGSIMGAFGNLFQFRQNVGWKRGKHQWKFGGEIRLNIDTTVFGMNPNGAYTFGGGAAYSAVTITSASGAHNIQPGDLLPDSLTGLLTATPFSYIVAAAPSIFAQGSRMGDSAVRRQAYGFYFQDSWAVTPNLSIGYGLRYEVSSRIGERNLLTSGIFFEGGKAKFLINPQPPYGMDWTGWSPRVSIDWSADSKTVLRVAGAINPLLVNLFQDNFVTGGPPYVVTPYVAAVPGAPVPFSNAVTPVPLPPIYQPNGQLVYPTGNSKDVAPNTEMDVNRFERELAALSSDKAIHALAAQGFSGNFRNGYVPSFMAGLERRISDFSVSAAYVGTVGVKLARINYPNGYGGADPRFAPYTQFDSAGKIVGGYGPITLMGSTSHSTYHSLQASLSKTSLRWGLGLQASYTLAKSIDDTSAVLGGFISSSSGTILQASPQDPNNVRADKGPSTFDVRQALALSLIQELPVNRVPGLDKLGRRFTYGWQLFGMAAFSTGSPFTIYSGIQQTGVGSNGADRPDQIGTPVLSTSRTVREDYFGLGASNASYFSIPTGVQGGTGPNEGRFGSLGRNTFRGPGYKNLDIALTKNTPIGSGSNPERVVLQFRAEFFNILNLVNFGLPANIVLGPGFGQINRTAGTSRQIQLSLKVLY